MRGLVLLLLVLLLLTPMCGPDDVVAFDVNVQTGAYQTGKVTFYTCVSAELESQVFYLYSWGGGGNTTRALPDMVRAGAG